MARKATIPSPDDDVVTAKEGDANFGHVHACIRLISPEGVRPIERCELLTWWWNNTFITGFQIGMYNNIYEEHTHRPWSGTIKEDYVEQPIAPRVKRSRRTSVQAQMAREAAEKLREAKREAREARKTMPKPLKTRKVRQAKARTTTRSVDEADIIDFG